jgi:hypothetical protein
MVDVFAEWSLGAYTRQLPALTLRRSLPGKKAVTKVNKSSKSNGLSKNTLRMIAQAVKSRQSAAPRTSDRPAVKAAKAPKAPKAAKVKAPAAAAPVATPKAAKAPKAEAAHTLSNAAKVALLRQLEAEAAAQAAAPVATKKAPKAFKTAKAEAPAAAAPVAPAKAAKAPKLSKAAKARRVDTNSYVHAPETLEACGGKAPKGDSIHACFLQFLAQNAASNSEAFTDSLRRPLGEFMDFLKAQRITTWAQLDSKALVAYRKTAKHTQGGEVRALSTMRMSLTRVITFLRAQPEGTINADISILRVKHTDEEKAVRAEAAAEAVEE